MPDNYDPPTDPAPWDGFQRPQPPSPPRRQRSIPHGGDRHFEPATARLDDMASAARSAGLRRLSKLTWRATQLSAIAAVGFATLFARSAPAHNTAAAAKPSAKPSPSPSPSPTHHRRHHRRKATPSPTLAAPTTPPTTPPAPAPSPTPAQTTSGGSGGG